MVRPHVFMNEKAQAALGESRTQGLPVVSFHTALALAASLENKKLQA